MEPASKTGRYRRYRRRKARPVLIAFLRREYRHCRRARRRGFARLLTERSVSTSVPEFARLFAGGESHERTRLGSGFRSSQKSESDFQRFLDDSGLGKRGFARKINAVRWTSLGCRLENGPLFPGRRPTKRLVLCIFFECAFGRGGSFSLPIK